MWLTKHVYGRLSKLDIADAELAINCFKTGRIYDFLSKKKFKICRSLIRSTKELFQSTKKTLFWPKLLSRRQSFEKTVQKGAFGHFFEHFLKKIAFFRRALPPQN